MSLGSKHEVRMALASRRSRELAPRTVFTSRPAQELLARSGRSITPGLNTTAPTMRQAAPGHMPEVNWSRSECSHALAQLVERAKNIAHRLVSGVALTARTDRRIAIQHRDQCSAGARHAALHRAHGTIAD